jgi:4-hydroxybenzoate polyprenyltransferase
MVAARTWAMLVNRLVDRRFDAGNARTARRVFASGAVSAKTGWLTAGSAAGVFFIAAAGFGVGFGGSMENWWPLILAGPVLAWIAFYSWTKRFTWWCHAVLGSALAASPLAAAISVDPGAVGLPGLGGAEVGAVVPAVWWLAGFVLCWVAGFDVIYALQDVEFDRGRGLRSVPASLGVGAALWISRGLHAAAAGLLFMAWRSDGRFGVIFAAGVALAAGLLVLEHAVLAKRGKAGLDMAFFTINGIVSVVVGGAGVVEVGRQWGSG